MGDPLTDLMNAGTDAVKGVTAVTKKTKNLLVDIDSLILDLTGLVVANLEIPRSDEELSDDELRTITALRARQDELVAEIRAAGGSDEDEALEEYINNWDDRSSFLTAPLSDDQVARLKKLHDLAVDIRRFRLAIHIILYHPAGVIPETLGNINETIGRFHTLEQPRIETIMDSSDDAIRETTEILEEIKKLFVTKKWIAKDTSRLTVKEAADLEWLKQQKLAYTHLIDKHRVISDHIHKNMIRFTGPVENTKITSDGAAGRILDVRKNLGANMGTAAFQGTASRYISPRDLTYIKDFTALQGILSSYERELFRIEKKITGLSFELVDEPGVVPKALEDVHLSVHRFRTEEQPRIEKILDVTAETLAESRVVLVSVDATVNESKNLVSQLNTSLGKVQGWFDFVSAYRVPLLVGGAVFVFLTVAIMVAVLIVLIKMALA